AFVLNCAGDMLRDERQNCFFSFGVAHLLGVALYDQNAEYCVAGLQRNAQPVQRRSPDHFHFALLYELVEHFRSGQQGLPSSQYVLCQSFSWWSWIGLGIFFVDE